MALSTSVSALRPIDPIETESTFLINSTITQEMTISFLKQLV
jgi:hypothetical protein